MKVFLFIALLLLGSASVASEFDHSHQALTSILQQHVVVAGPVSQVNYAGLNADQAALDAYLAQLSAITMARFDQWNRNQRMAFLINAYNSFTLKLIRDNLPVESIKDLGSLFTSPWEKKFFKLFGEDFYLDRIEHEILRKEYREPRIHFAVNCASIGCPMLLNRAYTADALEQQLDQQTRLFLQDETRNRIDLDKEVIYISKIFDWFEEDFVKAKGSVAAFVAPYMVAHGNEVLMDRISGGEFDIRFLSYDWNLNSADPPESSDRK